MADVESKTIPHELPSSHWLKATGQCVLERYLSATMACIWTFFGYLRCTDSLSELKSIGRSNLTWPASTWPASPATVLGRTVLYIK